MPENIRSLRLKRLHTLLGDVAVEMTSVHFSKFCSCQGWRPAVNAYSSADGIKICVDLAGVDKNEIHVQVEPGRLVISGRREPPEPALPPNVTLRILAMEIDCGPFERVVTLPARVDSARVTAEQVNGLLWIDLPLRPHG